MKSPKLNSDHKPTKLPPCPRAVCRDQISTTKQRQSCFKITKLTTPSRTSCLDGVVSLVPDCLMTSLLIWSTSQLSLLFDE
ncbi:hypothetical protein MOVS_08025 [Moraxella ovis]|uniref:Uncharacterized protein n=1 Tax=Moraxella ovis TaxID=29433 RepID=A0ABN4PQN5_9GAMM|nr:hypothetical protein MOVS_08025 [Moraxella ovis]